MALATSQALDLKLRRRAAFITLAEVLEGDQLMRAMWMLEERDQSADKMTFIGFFGVTAELLGIKSNLITTLYSKLNQNLDLPDHQLHDDPMPQMLEYRGISNAGQQAQPEKAQATKNVTGKKKGSLEMTVFVALISRLTISAGYPQAESYQAFNEAVKEEIATIYIEDSSRKQIIDWVDVLNLTAFKSNFAPEELSPIVHCMYIALCEVLGPVEADKILNQAIHYTSQLPLAKKFSPKNFL